MSTAHFHVMAKGLEELPKMAGFFPMRILVVTNMLPTQDDPNSGRFIQQQIEALRRIGLDVDVLRVNREEKGMRAYASLPAMLRRAVARLKPDLVHVMYGGIMSRLP